MIVYRRIRSTDAHSVLLEWVKLNGGTGQWLFTADNKEISEVKFKSINNINAFRGIPESNKRELSLKTSSLSEQEYEFVKDLQFTNLVTVTFEGFEFRASLSSIKITELNPLKLRDFSLKILLQPTLLMNN